MTHEERTKTELSTEIERLRRDVADLRQAQAKMAEERQMLRQSLQKFRALADSTNDVLYSADTAGILTYVSPQVERYGLCAEEMVGRPFIDFIIPEERATVAQDFQTSISTGKEFPTVFRVRDKEGNLRWIEDHGRVQRDESGGITGITGILRDITAHRRLDAELAESEGRFRAIFECANDGIIIVDIDTKKFLIGNPAACLMLGYGPSELEGLGVADIHPKDALPYVMEQFEKQVRKEITLATDIPLKRKNGEIVYADINAFPITLAGRSCLVGIFRDITEHKRAEEALVESEQKFRTLAEDSPNMIFINRRGRIAYANRRCEEILGRSLAELYSQDFDYLSLHAPECVELVKSRFECHMKGEELDPCELTLLTKGGERIETLLSTRLVPYEGDRAILGILTDISELKRVEKRLRQNQERLRALAFKLASTQEEERRRIAGGLHDEVGQLLVACQQRLALLDAARSSRKQKPLIAEVHSLLSETVDQVRELTFELSSHTLYAVGFAEAIDELCEHMGRRFGVRFTVQRDAGFEDVPEALRSTLYHVVREILFNVVKHADTREAWVRLQSSEPEIRVEVEDRGKGFDPAVIDRTFTDKGGYGLFHIHEQLQAIGGRMSVVSKLGDGACVTIEAPKSPHRRGG